MGEFRRIKVSLFLLLLLQFTAAAGQLFNSSTVRVGADVTVSCANLIDDQSNCNGTTWTFAGSRTSSEVRLVFLGQNRRPGRLSVTVDCSLVIEKVAAEDAGLYDCHQYNRSGIKQGPVGQVLLSVVTMTEMKKADETTLNCSVSMYEECTHTVKWLHRSPGVKTSGSSCSASLTFLPSRLVNMSSSYSFMCEVIDGHSTEKERFPFRLQSSGDKPGEKTTTTEPTGTTGNSEAAGTTTRTSAIDGASTQPQAPAGCSAVNYIMLVLRVAELLLITVITVLLIRAAGNHRPPDDSTLSDSVRRPPLRRSGAAASQVNDDEDEDDGVVNYENFGDSSASVRLR